MMSVGQKLRQARESRGLTIQQVAVQTKISSRYLQAIEADDPKSLPGAFFYKSFVQQYAGVLDVPMEDLRWELDRVVPPPERTVDEEYTPPPEAHSRFLTEPEPLTSRMGFRLGLLVVMVIACSAVYALWDKMQRAPSAEATTKAAPMAAPVAVEAKPALRPVTTSPVVSTDSITTLKSEDPATAPTLSNVTVAASEPAWLQMKIDGKVAYAGVLQPSETKNFDHFETASLLVGNAGALTVMFNGKPVGEIGPKGQVRTVTFTTNKFEIQRPVTQAQEYRAY